MSSIVTAALIGAGTRLFTTFFEIWSASQKPDKKQKAINKWINNNYKSLHESLSSDCVRLLAELDGGKTLRLGDLVKVLYPKLSLTNRNLKLFKDEFRYRLEFLTVIGVLCFLPYQRRYKITRLGVAFLEQARAKKDHHKVLLRN